MSTRLTRRVAGQEITRSVAASSARLLVDEEAAFARIDRLLDQHSAGLVEKVRTAAGRRKVPANLARDPSTRLAVLEAAQQVVDGSVRTARALAEGAAEEALESSGKELRLCERTLSARYAGTADRAVKQVNVSEVAAPGVAGYEASAGGSLTFLGTAYDVQLGKAKDADELVLRLFSPDPVTGVRGFTGRGVWWQMGSGLKSSLRWISIETSNRTRILAMAAFNTAADDEG